MKLDVVFTPSGLTAGEVQGRIVFVIDILRAGTTMCAALFHGARAVVPVGSTEEALRLAQTLGSDDTLLAGERNCIPIPGFHLGNSPREMLPEVVRGKTIIMTTTNGTDALLATAGAAEVSLAGAANFSIASARAREAWTTREDLLIICSGREQRFALDLVRRYGRNWERPLQASRGGRHLAELGMVDDIVDAAQVDAYPVRAVFQDRRVVAL